MKQALLIFALFALLFAQGSHDEDSVALRKLLIANWDSSWINDPDNYKQWDDRYPISEWYGVVLEDDRVVELKFDTCRLTEIPQEFGNLKKLRKLHLSGNHLTTLPNQLGNLESLEKLTLDKNDLVSLPDSFGNLGALTSLDLAQNDLQELPETFGNLNSLKVLSLKSNGFSLFPTPVTRCDSLSSLNMSYNSLTEIPADIGTMINLELLFVADNQLSELPTELAALTTLRSLVLEENLFETFPAVITDLPQLELLNLNENDIAELPEDINRLQNLTYLYLEKNAIATLPASIVELPQLKEIDIRNNVLESFPDSLHHLTELLSINIYGNELEFDDFEQLSAERDMSIFYTAFGTAPLFYYQKQVPLTLSEDSTVVYANTRGAQNKYSWYHEKEFLGYGSADSVVIDPADLETGRIYCTVKNAILPELELTSDSLGSLPVAVTSSVGHKPATFSFSVMEQGVAITAGVTARASIALYDIHGRVIQQWNEQKLVEGEKLLLNSSNQPASGVYLLTIESGSSRWSQAIKIQ